jgi:hypothetical protein
MDVEPAPLIPNVHNKPFSENNWLKWRRNNPNLKGTLSYDEYDTWRVLSQEGASVTKEGYLTNPVNDLLRTGQVRGTAGFGGSAYFNAGFPAEEYRSTAVFDKLGNQVDNMGSFGMYTSRATPLTKNIYIQATPQFMERAASGANPLYDSISSRGFISQGSDLLTDKTRQGDPWKIIRPEALKEWEKASQGVSLKATPFNNGYLALNPSENPSFIDRVNPWNRQGLRVMQTSTAPVANGSEVYRLVGNVPQEILDRDFIPVGNSMYRPRYSGNTIIPKEMKAVTTTIGPLNMRTLYDGITPFTERTIGQHLRNAKWNATSLYVQPEVQTAIAGATKAGGAATFLLETPSITAREDRIRRSKYPADYTGPRDASLLETAQMVGKGVVGSVANSLTMGMTGVGSNESRGGRGPARMEDTGNEITRRTMERANSWVPSINDDIKEHSK